MNKNEKFVITINRELGSGGRTVGRKLAAKLGVKYYDKALVQGLTEKFGLSIERIEEIKAQKKSWWNDFNNYYTTLVDSSGYPIENQQKVTNTTIFETEKRILQELAAKESCVVAGRSGFLVFSMWPNHLSVFIQASLEKRIAREMKKKGITHDEALAIINEVDAARETFIKKYTDTSRYNTRNYQLVISMDELTEDGAVDLILRYIENTNNAQ